MHSSETRIYVNGYTSLPVSYTRATDCGRSKVVTRLHPGRGSASRMTIDARTRLSCLEVQGHGNHLLRLNGEGELVRRQSFSPGNGARGFTPKGYGEHWRCLDACHASFPSSG